VALDTSFSSSAAAAAAAAAAHQTTQPQSPASTAKSAKFNLTKSLPLFKTNAGLSSKSDQLKFLQRTSSDEE
jgi:hypothetical protein